MDKLKERLKRDAAAIDGEVPAELRARIDAARADTSPRPAPGRGQRRPRLAWYGATAGLVAAAALLFVASRQPVESPPVVATVTPATDPLLLPQPLALERVRFTEPLQQELTALRADLEKARDTIENDLRNSL